MGIPKSITRGVIKDVQEVVTLTVLSCRNVMGNKGHVSTAYCPGTCRRPILGMMGRLRSCIGRTRTSTCKDLGDSPQSQP